MVEKDILESNPKDIFDSEDSFILGLKDRVKKTKKLMSYSNVFGVLNEVVNAGLLYFAKVRYRLLKKKQNWICVIVGKTGSGKSYTALSIAKLVNPNFDPRRDIVFSGRDYVDRIQNVNVGDVIVWDEAGVGIGSRDFATKINRNLGKIFQTQRFKRFGVIMTVPSLDLIDKQPRELIHTIISMDRIIYSYGIALAKVYDVIKDPVFGHVLNVKPKIKFGGEIYRIRKIAIKKPDAETIRIYEGMKDEFFRTEVLDKARMEQEMEELAEMTKERIERQKWEHIEEVAKEIVKNPQYFGKMKGGKWVISVPRIQVRFKETTSNARLIKARAEDLLNNKE